MTEETEPKLRLNMAACYNKVSHISLQEYKELYERCDSATRQRLTLCYKQVTQTRVPQSAASKRASVVNFALGSLYGAKQQCAAAKKAILANEAALAALPSSQTHEQMMKLAGMRSEFAGLEDNINDAIVFIKRRASVLTQLRKQK